MSDMDKILALDWRSGMLFIAAIIILAVFILQKTDWLAERFGITSKRKMAEEKRDQEIKELKDHAERSDGNFEKVFTSIDQLQTSVNELSTKVTDMQKRIDENEAAKLGDRISQAYHFYRKRGFITPMEKWAFDNMVKQYQASGGDSWIDEVAVPASRGWEVVDQ